MKEATQRYRALIGHALHALESRCSKCPRGSYKAIQGDSLELCVPCPASIAVSSDDRRTCECFRLGGGAGYNATTHKLAFEDGQHCVAVLTSYRDEAEQNRRRLSRLVSSTRFTRTRQFECEKGHYCTDGVRYRCPAGFYGYQSRETSPWCSGLCDAGYYCPFGSSARNQIACGAADASVYCPRGSVVPTRVTPGYYTARVDGWRTGGTNDWQEYNETIRDRQVKCPKGYFCIQGRRHRCPAGRYGAVEGETSPYVRHVIRRLHFVQRVSLRRISVLTRVCIS